MKQKKLANILNIEVFLNNRDIKKKIAYRLAHIYNKISLLNDELNKYDEQTFTTDYFIHNIPNSTLLRVIFNHIQRSIPTFFTLF